MTKENRNGFVNFASPIIILSQIFGIAPRIRPSKYKDLMHLVLQYSRIALVTVMLFYKNPENIQLNHDLINYVVMKTLLIAYVVSVFEAIFTRKRQLKIVNQLCRIDEIIAEKFCSDFDKDGMQKRYTRSIWAVFVGVIVFKIVNWTLFYERVPGVVFTVWAYAHLAINMRLLQNAFYVDMVYERLCIVHKELNKLKENYCKNVQRQLDLTSDIYGRLWVMTNDINLTFG